jgi:hypothetical protein
LSCGKLGERLEANIPTEVLRGGYAGELPKQLWFKQDKAETKNTKRYNFIGRNYQADI